MREKGESAFDDVVAGDEDEKKTEDKPASQDSKAPGEDGTPNVETGAGDSESEESAETVAGSDPAFLFAAVDQRPLYIRPETWERFEDQKYYAEGKLREQYGVRNVESREFDEAIAQLVVEELSPGDIAEKIVEIRGYDP